MTIPDGSPRTAPTNAASCRPKTVRIAEAAKAGSDTVASSGEVATVERQSQDGRHDADDVHGALKQLDHDGVAQVAAAAVLEQPRERRSPG